MKYLIYPLFIVSLMILGCETQNDEMQEPEETVMLKEKIERFAPTELKYDSSILDERQKMVVEKLYHAAKVMDELFLEQVYSRNQEIKDGPNEDAGEKKIKRPNRNPGTDSFGKRA